MHLFERFQNLLDIIIHVTTTVPTVGKLKINVNVRIVDFRGPQKFAC